MKYRAKYFFNNFKAKLLFCERYKTDSNENTLPCPFSLPPFVEIARVEDYTEPKLVSHTMPSKFWKELCYILQICLPSLPSERVCLPYSYNKSKFQVMSKQEPHLSNLTVFLF